MTCATALVRLAELLAAVPSGIRPDAVVSLGILGALLMRKAPTFLCAIGLSLRSGRENPVTVGLVPRWNPATPAMEYGRDVIKTGGAVQDVSLSETVKGDEIRPL